MKKTLLLITLSLLAVTLNSCSDNDDDGGSGNVKLVKKVAVVGDDASWQYTYDNQNRPIKVIFYDEQDGQTQVSNITYADKLITVTTDDDKNNEIDTEKYHLDNDGYLIKYEYNNDYTEYTYKEGYLNKSTAYFENGETLIITYTWSNGNLIAVTEGDNITKTTATYDNNENKFNIRVVGDIDNMGLFKFKGTYSKNYVTKADYSGGDFDTYTYDFDKDGYPTKAIMTYSDGYINTYYIEYY